LRHGRERAADDVGGLQVAQAVHQKVRADPGQGVQELSVAPRRGEQLADNQQRPAFSEKSSAARFYRDQLGLEQVYESEGRLAVRCGPTRLFLHPTEESERGPWNVELYFQVDNVDDAVSRLRAHGVGVLLEPTDEPWGERNAGILDPDGYPVYLTQSLEDSWTTRSPAPSVTSAPNP
jgi:lactoylglutathione lyase